MTNDELYNNNSKTGVRDLLNIWSHLCGVYHHRGWSWFAAISHDHQSLIRSVFLSLLCNQTIQIFTFIFPGLCSYQAWLLSLLVFARLNQSGKNLKAMCEYCGLEYGEIKNQLCCLTSWKFGKFARKKYNWKKVSKSKGLFFCSFKYIGYMVLSPIVCRLIITWWVMWLIVTPATCTFQDLYLIKNLDWSEGLDQFFSFKLKTSGSASKCASHFATTWLC